MNTRRFDYDLASVSEARRHVREVLRDQPRGVVDVAELLTSELVTNAIRHGASGFELKIELDENVRVEVRDEGAGNPHVISAGPQDPSGRGLGIVEALSIAWGVIPTADGKTVWYELPLAPMQRRSVPRASAEHLTSAASKSVSTHSSRAHTRRRRSGKATGRGTAARALGSTRTP
jgi:anti-sigma regulatory factor (Ser/Thr protein kinase)